ncbi:TPA: hypothetical protein ACNGYY_003493 [Klebsiella quasipneumoniae subsp. similipneumoniae]
MNNKTEFKFGDYAIIEQKRHGVPNEMFVHKVIDQLRSNTWVDVPVQSPATETMHDEMEDVCLCICCGVDETEVRRYRVKDMRRHSPVSAVTDEKKGSTITLQAVNELIASLESAGELSIKETKVMALAKAYQQLAAENVALKNVFGPGDAVLNFLTIALRHTTYDQIDLDDVTMAFKMSLPETPATDRIVAAQRSAFVDEAVSKIAESGALTVGDCIVAVCQLREGADK